MVVYHTKHLTEEKAHGRTTTLIIWDNIKHHTFEKLEKEYLQVTSVTIDMEYGKKNYQT